MDTVTKVRRILRLNTPLQVKWLPNHETSDFRNRTLNPFVKECLKHCQLQLSKLCVVDETLLVELYNSHGLSVEDYNGLLSMLSNSQRYTKFDVFASLCSKILILKMGRFIDILSGLGIAKRLDLLKCLSLVHNFGIACVIYDKNPLNPDGVADMIALAAMIDRMMFT